MQGVVVRDARGTEQRLVWHLALAGPHASAAEARRAVSAVEDYLRRCGGRLAGLHLAERGGLVLAVIAAIDLPGRVSMLLLPGWTLERAGDDLLRDLLAHAAARAADRNNRFTQVLLEVDSALRLGGALQAAGFQHLADLCYMQRSAFDPIAIQEPANIHWQTLQHADSSTFARVIRRSYIGSMDCPALTGIRSMDEVLASHKAAGDFNPGGWFLLLRGAEPVGVVLTCRVPNRSALEVVYMGLVPEARGEGLGKVLLARAIRHARDCALSEVTLAVDENNAPARRLYAAMGFYTTGRRSAWIKVFRRADEEGQFERFD